MCDWLERNSDEAQSSLASLVDRANYLEKKSEFWLGTEKE